MKKIVHILLVISFCFYSSNCIPDPSILPPNTIPPLNILDPNYATASKKLPQTTALDKELRSMHSSFEVTSKRVKKVKSTVKNSRYAALAAVKMIDQIRSIERQISRLKRELKSISKIPQFRMLKPIAKGVASLGGKVKKIREKAEKLRDKKIKPSITKMKKLEAKLAKLDSGLRHAQTETSSTIRHIHLLKNFVVTQKFPENQVRAIELLSKTVRIPITPAKNALSEFDSACSDLESLANTYKKHMSNLTKLQPGLDKVKAKMAPIDKKVKGIAKVLDKKLGFKVPFSKPKKEIAFTVRNILEAPGKILDIAVKPLTKMAEKLLKPITKNLKFDIKAPKELQKISLQLDVINKFSFNIDRPTAKFDNPTNTRAIENYRAALRKLTSTSTAQLAR